MRIAVTGAGGAIGGQVVDLLAAEANHQVVALTRRKLPADPRGNVRNAVADYSDFSALRQALRDVDTLVFVSSDGPVARVMVQHHNVIRAAAENGVRHIVALSALDADVRSPFCYSVSYALTEQLIAESGCSFSIVRASIYMEFFCEFLVAARKSGKLRVPAGDGRISLVARGDVARCIAALASTDPTGSAHAVTGPESLDMSAVAAVTERAWGVTVEYVDVPPREYCTELAAAGENPWWLYAYATMFESVREQRWATRSEVVEALTALPAVPLGVALADGATPGPNPSPS